MNIIPFTHTHIREASEIALACYNEQRFYVPDLPHMERIPGLSEFAEHKLGVAAVEDGKTLGFLCCCPPRDNDFTTNARGTFSPIHAHGSISRNRADIYKRMYQEIAEKLVRSGVGSHAVALYAHDREVEKAFFTYGFGLRCIDAIRSASAVTQEECPYEIRMLDRDEFPCVRALRRALSAHLGESPCFMVISPQTFHDWLIRAETGNSQLFAAFENGEAVAFLEVADEGENFASEAPDMKNICGAYCLPEYRGRGIMQGLLNHAITENHKNGVKRIGVDFESFNPTAYGFWLKYFTAYTHSVVRRIDESALSVYSAVNGGPNEYA